MKLIAISGSPRAKGNTVALLKEAADACRSEGVEAEVLLLSEYDIRQCDGCLACEAAGCSGHCSIQDDMTSLLAPKLLQANAVIFGTPSYFDQPTGLLKKFMDRTNMALNVLTQRRLCYGTIVVGQSNIESLMAAAQAVERYCSICGMLPAGIAPVTAIARDIGDVGGNVDAIQSARALGRAMARGLLQQ